MTHCSTQSARPRFTQTPTLGGQAGVNNAAGTETAVPQDSPLPPFYRREEGLATAEYGIVMLAAVAFAGLLTAVLTSDTVQGWLEALVQQALNT